MITQNMTVFETVEDLFYRVETGNNLDQAETLLESLSKNESDPAILARVYAELAQAQVWRYEYAPANQRLAFAEKGVKLANRALEYDQNNLQANFWAAATMGTHGMEMGIMSSLFYLGRIKAHCERVLQLDETYQSAAAHQILGDLYRMTPPRPIGMGDKQKALEHLQRARELAPTCPKAKLRLAELYISLRKKDLARQEIQLLLDQEIPEHGPIYAEKVKLQARDLLSKKLGNN